MKSWTTRVAFAGRCSTPPSAPAPDTGAAARPSRASKAASAIPPSPPPERQRNSRRVAGVSGPWSRWYGDSFRDIGPPSIDEHELAEVEDDPAHAGQAEPPSVV